MDFYEIITTAASAIFVYVSFIYGFAQLKKDASVIDVAWGGGQVVIAFTMLLIATDMTIPRALVSIFTVAWGMRLAGHIGLRKIGKPEDWRYRQWRKDWGDTYWWRSIVQIFVLQGLLMLVMAAPIFVVTHESNLVGNENVYLTALGAFLWWYGFLFESVGDWQLSQFLKDKKNKGKVMKSGLWQYTRHPNYFGEVTQWWGLFLIVAPLNYGLLAIVSPVLITFLILKVSGITMLEKKYAKNRAYQDYKKKTSAFFPRPPKK